MRRLKIAAALLLAATTGGAYAQDTSWAAAVGALKNAPAETAPAGAVYHIAQAHKIAGKDAYLTKWIDGGVLCQSIKQSGAMFNASRTKDVEAIPWKPVKMFDNLWMFGNSYAKALILKTSIGLVMIDTTDNSDEAENIVEKGMVSMGLNPADLKYIIITHGHGDHWGGTYYFQSKYHPKVAAFPEDWELIANPQNEGWKSLPKPTHDIDLTDGQDLVIGDTTLHIIKTPGHSPGVASMIVPVKDKGKSLNMDLWGGTAYSNALQMHDSLHKLWAVGQTYHAVGMLNTHAYVNEIDDQIASLPTAKSNPFVLGEAKLNKLFAIQDECNEAYLSWLAVAPPRTGPAPAAQ